VASPENGREPPQPGDIDRLVHEPARLMVLACLAVVDGADATFLLHQTGLTWGNLASHLGKLEQAGYVEVEKSWLERRPRTVLRLSPEGRAALLSYRDQLRQVLDGLDRPAR
jgi:DNA-binding MarR family transcriptional regulator